MIRMEDATAVTLAGASDGVAAVNYQTALWTGVLSWTWVSPHQGSEWGRGRVFDMSNRMVLGSSEGLDDTPLPGGQSESATCWHYVDGLEGERLDPTGRWRVDATWQAWPHGGPVERSTSDETAASLLSRSARGLSLMRARAPESANTTPAQPSSEGPDRRGLRDTGDLTPEEFALQKATLLGWRHGKPSIDERADSGMTGWAQRNTRLPVRAPPSGPGAVEEERCLGGLFDPADRLAHLRVEVAVEHEYGGIGAVGVATAAITDPSVS